MIIIFGEASMTIAQRCMVSRELSEKALEHFVKAGAIAERARVELQALGVLSEALSIMRSASLRMSRSLS